MTKLFNSLDLCILFARVWLQSLASLLPVNLTAAESLYHRDHIVHLANELLCRVSVSQCHCAILDGCDAQISSVRLGTRECQDAAGRTSKVDSAAERSAELVVSGVALAYRRARVVYAARDA